MLWLWLSALVIAAVGFGVRSRTWPRFSPSSRSSPLAAAALCAPLYLIALYRWPVQVSSDEVAIMDAAREYAHAPEPIRSGVSTTSRGRRCSSSPGASSEI